MHRRRNGAEKSSGAALRTRGEGCRIFEFILFITAVPSGADISRVGDGALAIREAHQKQKHSKDRRQPRSSAHLQQHSGMMPASKRKCESTAFHADTPLRSRHHQWLSLEDLQRQLGVGGLVCIRGARSRTTAFATTRFRESTLYLITYNRPQWSPTTTKTMLL